MAPHRNPTPKTLVRKLWQAQQALDAGNLIAVDHHRHVVADLNDLGIDEATYWSLLPRLIQTVLADDPARCYAGRYPADRVSKHPAFHNLEMWAFKTRLSEFPFLIYFKFCLRENPTTKELEYCHVDCHPNRE